MINCVAEFSLGVFDKQCFIGFDKYLNAVNQIFHMLFSIQRLIGDILNFIL